MKPNAYEISEAIARASLMVDPETGEFTPEAEAIFAEVERQAPTAVDIYGKVKANAEVEACALKGAIDGLELEIARLRGAIDERKRTADRMVGRIRSLLEATGEDVIKGETFTAKFAKVADALGDVREEKVPVKYWASKTTHRVDRKAILAALKAGKTVSGASLLTGRRRVVIR